MVSSIGSSSVASLMQRPDPSQMAGKLFSKLDSKNQGYIEKSDLQSAFDQIKGAGNTGNSASVDEVFKQLDGDGDGKVTRQEMSDSLTRMAEQLDSQFNSMRMNGMGGMHGMGGMQQGGMQQGGFTQDELQSQLDEIGSTGSKRASLLTNIVNNFDAADTDGDGKVSAQEAKAFDQASQPEMTAASDADSEANVMRKIMQLVQAYGDFGLTSGQPGSTGTLSTSA